MTFYRQFKKKKLIILPLELVMFVVQKHIVSPIHPLATIKGALTIFVHVSLILIHLPK